MKHDRFEPDAGVARLIPPGRRVGGEPANEAEHFMKCDHCGQAFDMRNLGDVLHHNTTEHEPIGSAQ